MTILPNIEEAMEDARNGKLSPYWQNDLKRECLHRKLSDEERQALSELNRILSETPQWSGEEELCIEMENIGGRVCFCHFWDEHYSMVQLTEDRNGKYSAAYVLDAETFTLLSLDETLVAPDGSTRPYVTATIEYDVERPELAQTMYEHSTAIENLRQVTLTTDPDTENEETFSVQVPKGDGVVIYLPEGYDGIFTDRACTKEEESPIDRNADATLYMAKGK